jgi:hypothetical protein
MGFRKTPTAARPPKLIAIKVKPTNTITQP